MLVLYSAVFFVVCHILQIFVLKCIVVYCEVVGYSAAQQHRAGTVKVHAWQRS